MKKGILVALLSAAMAATTVAPAFAADELILAAGGTTGTYYAVGGVMATVLNQKLEDASLTVESTGASKANIQMLDDGDADLAIVQNDVMYYAYNGTDLFEKDGAIDTFATVAGVYNETVQIVTGDDSIQSVADLKGKSVSVGDAGSGTEFNAKQILEAYDITFDDIKVVNASFGDSAESIKDGKIDAAFVVAGAPTTAVVDLATTKDVHVISLDEEHIKGLQENYNFYTETTIPAGTYKGVDEDTTTVSVRATLIASTEIGEDVVYEFTKALFENQEELATGHDKFTSLSLEGAVDGQSVPFHPGAAKYFAEQGVEVETAE